MTFVLVITIIAIALGMAFQKNENLDGDSVRQETLRYISGFAVMRGFSLYICDHNGSTAIRLKNIFGRTVFEHTCVDSDEGWRRAHEKTMEFLGERSR